MVYVKLKGKKIKVQKKNSYDTLGSAYEVINMETLDLKAQNIKDISEIEGLENLTNLRKLSIRENKLTKIKGLESLSDLELLDLCENKIREIEGLENLSKLRVLDLSHNEITEMKGLNSLTKLVKLLLNSNKITKIKDLEKHDELLWLNLSDQKQNHKISEIEGLENLSMLTDLYLNNNVITEIKGLESCVDLDTLGLNRNKISEISGLERLKNLNHLYLNYNQITEIKGLSGLIHLKTLELDENKITEIKGLEKLFGLERLDLNRNQITEIKGLQNLSKLYGLWIGVNPIPHNTIELLGGTFQGDAEFLQGKVNNPQRFVLYCQTLEVQIEKESIENTSIKEVPVSNLKPQTTLKASSMDIGRDVFICHSSKDKKIANTVCHKLEQNGIKCWIAPRDVSPGSYAASIVQAIEASKLLVLIFSKNSNVSDHVKNELEIAVSSSITIIPFRIENIEPSTDMKYYIQRMHWLDALTPPIEAHLTGLVAKVSTLLVNRK